MSVMDTIRDELSDDQLRAEAERRGMVPFTAFPCVVARAERDRDEWKRRAEKAEAELEALLVTLHQQSVIRPLRNSPPDKP